MKRCYSIGLIAGMLALSACQQQPAKNAGGAGDIESGRALDPQSPPATPSSPPSPPPLPAPVTPSTGSGENDGYPDLTPAPLTGDAAKSETGARSLVLSWARAVELREFDQAWEMMGKAGQAQISKGEFNALFHPLRDITVAVPTGSSEGAAGSIYYTAPATVTGTRVDGSKAVLKGEVVLRRVNDVDGATPAQLRWHFAQVNLAPA